TGGSGGAQSGTGGGLPCVTAADCTAPDGECATATCESGMCGVALTPAGTPTKTQAAGDCKRTVCDGNGTTQTESDDTDSPDDGKDCRVDACANGMPSHTAASQNTSCTGGVCDDAGMCVECNAASQCPGADSDCAHRTCVAGVCGTAFTPTGTATAI